MRQAMTPPVGERLREAQAAKDLTNEQLAGEVGVTVRLLQKWRSGDVTPSYPNLLKLARILEREIGWFYSTDGDDREAA